MLLTRRQWLGAAAVAALAAHLPQTASATTAQPFDFNWLYEQAKALAAKPYQAPAKLESEWLAYMGYDAYRAIGFRSDKALWRERASRFRAEFFHPGTLYMTPTPLFEVSGGMARPIAFEMDRFHYGGVALPDNVKALPLGYTGFRLQNPLNRPDKWDEIAVFQGASYFRSLGRDQHYGLSARGLAIDTASGKGEEFPDFTAFWLQRPAPGDRRVTVFALLDSPSVTGAYRFVITPGDDVQMDVSARLFTRKAIDKLGIAPLTSMYAHGENDNRLGQDFRPEVHDSDGLLLHSATGEWLWRPLINPATLAVSTYTLPGLKGFGLLQRDRRFDNYQDIEAHYETRPSLWVEPKGNWGAGAVQLVEIPTDSEIHDNIVAYWVPARPVEAGQERRLDYRLSWGQGTAGAADLLQVVSTHAGRQFAADETKFVIDFAGQNRRYQRPDAALQPELWTSAGQIVGPALMPNPHTGGWRVVFNLKPGSEPVHELRCILRRNGMAASETWSYQWRKN
jgi:glucans biosynthesis protein